MYSVDELKASALHSGFLMPMCQPNNTYLIRFIFGLVFSDPVYSYSHRYQWVSFLQPCILVQLSRSIGHILATPVSLAACATAFATAGPTRGSNAFGII